MGDATKIFTPQVLLLGALTTIQVFVWGAYYSFPIWIPDLKSLLHLTQFQINVISSLVYASALAGNIAAPLLQPRFGLAFMFALAMVSGAGAYGLMFLTTFGGELAMAWLAGIATVLMGLSTGFCAPISIGTWLQCVPPSYFPFINAYTSLVYALGGTIVSVVYVQGITVHELLLVLCIAHAAAGGLTTFIEPPLFKRIKSGETITEIQKVPTEATPLLSGQAINEPKVEDVPAPAAPAPPTQSFKERFVLMGTSLNTWMVEVALILMVGVGGCFTTNLGNLTEALDGDSDRVGKMSLALAISQTVGRAVCFAITTAATFKNKDPTLALAAGVSIGFSSTLLPAYKLIDSSNLVYFTSGFGLAYGAMWSVSFMLLKFTALPQAENFSFVTACMLPVAGLAPLALNTIVGHLYDEHAIDGKCVGTDCYSTSMLILGIVAAPVLPIAATIAYRRHSNSDGDTETATISI